MHNFFMVSSSTSMHPRIPLIIKVRVLGTVTNKPFEQTQGTTTMRDAKKKEKGMNFFMIFVNNSPLVNALVNW